MDRFDRTMCILEVLAHSPTGVTAGMAAAFCTKKGCHLSRAQAERTLKQLGQGGWVHTEKRDYRTNIRSTYYHINEEAIIAMMAVASAFNEREKQLALTQ